MSSPSKVAVCAWKLVSRRVAQWARQTSDFAPEMEGMDAVSVGTAVGQAKPEDPDLCSGRDRLRFIAKSRSHRHPRDCTQATGIPTDLCIGRPTAVQLLSVYGETRRNHVKFTLVTRLLRSESHFHDVEGVSMSYFFRKGFQTLIQTQPRKSGWNN